MKILAFDTETGGLDPKDASLLTSYYAILDSKNFEIVDELYLETMPDDRLVKANPGALAVNKINVEEHVKKAVTYAEGKKQLEAFLKKHSPFKGALTPLAHNIDFDINFVQTHLLDKSTWEKYVSYRKLDTANLANFFKLCGWFDESQKMSLGDVAKALDIQFEGDGAHNAASDVKVMVKILKTMVDSLREIQ